MTVELDPNARPRLPRGVRLRQDADRGMLLLAPERVFKADPVAAEILKRCDGETTLAMIVDDLAATFSVERERVDHDVRNLLAGLVEKRMIDL